MNEDEVIEDDIIEDHADQDAEEISAEDTADETVDAADESSDEDSVEEVSEDDSEDVNAEASPVAAPAAVTLDSNGRHPDLRLLEAILFATVEPLSPNAIRSRMPEGTDVGGMLLQLQAEYAGRGIVLQDIDGSWAFRTAADLAEALTIEKDVQRKMSRAAMETLAVIAYHQPITRAEIENIRGVATNKGTLDVLLEAGWVKPGRRREAPGRPLTWVTTTSFLDHFGLEAITDLPGLDEMKASGLLDRRPAIDAIPAMNDLFGDDVASDGEGDYEEGDEGEAFEPYENKLGDESEAVNADAEAAEREKSEEEAA